MKKLTILIISAAAASVAFSQSLTLQQQSDMVQQFASRMSVNVVTNLGTNVVVTVILPTNDYATLDGARFSGESDCHYISRAFAGGVFHLRQQQAAFDHYAAQQAALMATNNISTNTP